MSDEPLDRRRRALEEQFFNKQNQELLKKLRAREAAAQQKQALVAATGIQSDAVLDELMRAKIGPEALAALSLAPVVLVAWRDGKLEPKERDAVLKAAAQAGLAPGSTSHELVQRWLKERPGPSLLSAWKSYAQALRGQLSASALDELRRDVLGRARAVAESAGGFLGMGKISSEEERLLAELDQALR